jgi:uncharacterized protein (TIGR04141 family)
VPRRPKLQKLTISLLKAELSRTDAIRDSDRLTAHRVPAIDAEQDSLFVAARPPAPPAWTTYLAAHVTESLEGLFTASASAVLLLEAADRVFAVTFGQGRHLLDGESFEQDFGLKVVLNTVDPAQLKSVDARTIDETTMHTRRDLSRDSSFAAFGLDVSRDLLRAVTGTPQDETLAHRLTGADALGIHTRAGLPDLPDLAERLLRHYEADDYKAHFDFIDHLRPEKNGARLRQLESMLVEALSTREITDVHLAAPETLDWGDVDGFRFSSGTATEADEKDPRIRTYLETRQDQDLDVSLLKRDRLIAMRASDGQPLASWSIYRCIVYQVESQGRLYVLSGGQWFRVDLDYRRRVEADVNALPRLQGMPPADPGTDEGSYNVKAAAELDALCLDQKLVYDGGPDKMEICDILTRSGGLIHVKHRGSSSTLSHLFTQGLNSAERLLLDDDFRAKARAVARNADEGFADVLPSRRPADPSAHEISFVVITRSSRGTPLTLPFFSVVSLRAAAARLGAFGFKVSVAAVPEA